MIPSRNILSSVCRGFMKINRSYATRKRFYRRADIIQNENKWEVTLDHRRLKTPNGQVLTVETEPLARAIAVEWDAQHETITQPTMHLVCVFFFKLRRWGRVPWAHELNQAELTSRVAASLLIIQNSTELHSQKAKKSPSE
ncbi:uncharacterized protein LOC119832384 [Zerene cesonia]|uniref:uncharacterized protein LOC119832384 n=1 Tax=Zerene cesonia TaxID=33412 RepID=UPI0018E5733F|nr:uncharacterized protein LOC119832384 [Zerene cesonia]